MTLSARAATPGDVPAMAQIYNEGIEDRAVIEVGTGRLVAFASTSTYRTRDCYAGIAEFSVYVSRPERGRGAGRDVVIVERVMPENLR